MNNFCDNFCNKTGANRDDLMNASLLSAPVPRGGCYYVGSQACSIHHSVDTDMMDIDATPEDEEEMALQEAFGKLNMNEVELSDRILLGTSTTGSKTTNGTEQNEEDEIQEGQKLLSQKSEELERTICRILREQGDKVDPDFEAYRLARNQNFLYVTNPLFTRGFLLAEDYDTEKAARRMFTYLTIKLELFGEEKLTRDILLDDLGDDGRAYLKSGALQVLPARDAAKRRVVFGVGRLNGSRDEAMGAQKAFFYFWSYVSEGDTERGMIKGMAGILWRVHKPPMPDAELADACRRIWMNAPLKISAYHMAYGPRTFDNFATMNLAWFRNKHIMRYRRAHFETGIRLLYKLKFTYGIPSECFPLKPGTENKTLAEMAEKGTSDLFNTISHDIWMEKRNEIDFEKKMLLNSATLSNGSVFANASFYSVRSSGASMRTSGLSMASSLFDGGSMDFSAVPDDTLIGGRTSANNSKRDSYPTRISCGTTMELLNSIIAEDSAAAFDRPMEDDNSISEDLKESHRVSESLVEVHPNTISTEQDIVDRDIKFGRGKPLQRHPGNMWLRKLISDRFEEYDSMDKREKTEFSKHIVHEIKSEGRRFWRELKETPGLWEIVGDDDVLREKVSVNIRTERKKRIGVQATQATMDC